MTIAELIAVFCAGTFFGAAVYISIAQNPALLEAGANVGARFFPPMYRRAAPMQITLSVGGALAGVVVWVLGGSQIWLVGALFLISVIPITLLAIKPVNDKLLLSSEDPDGRDTARLLRQWGLKHWLRSGVSGVAFILFLIALFDA